MKSVTTCPWRAAAVLALPVALLAACGRSAADSAPEPIAMTVGPESILVLAAREIRSGPTISGDLSAEREATLRAELGGSVMSIHVEVGQAVRRGQVLAVLDDAVAGEQLRSARSGLLAAENSAVLAHRGLERARRLFQDGAVADRDVETAESALLAAEAQRESARATLAAAEKLHDKSRLRAPFDGIVSERRASVGDIVQSGNPLFTVVDPSSMRLTGAVPAGALSALAIGSAVEFDVSGYEGRAFVGRVARISPVADPGTRQVRLVVAIPNPGHDLVAGLFARGRVTTTSRQALAVPIAAVDLRGALPTVRRLRDGRVEPVAVQLGVRDEVQELVEVTAGLTEGDTVLTGAGLTLAAGTPVVVRKE